MCRSLLPTLAGHTCGVEALGGRHTQRPCPHSGTWVAPAPAPATPPPTPRGTLQHLGCCAAGQGHAHRACRCALHLSEPQQQARTRGAGAQPLSWSAACPLRTTARMLCGQRAALAAHSGTPRACMPLSTTERVTSGQSSAVKGEWSVHARLQQAPHAAAAPRHLMGEAVLEPGADPDASSSVAGSFANSTPLLPPSCCWSSSKCEPACGQGRGGERPAVGHVSEQAAQGGGWGTADGRAAPACWPRRGACCRAPAPSARWRQSGAGKPGR